MQDVKWPEAERRLNKCLIGTLTEVEQVQGQSERKQSDEEEGQVCLQTSERLLNQENVEGDGLEQSQPVVELEHEAKSGEGCHGPQRFEVDIQLYQRQEDNDESQE